MENCATTSSHVAAVHHVRRMRGGSQSHLMHCSDGRFYVVKFQNNPQHIRVLANELIASQLARSIGLPVPETAVVEVDARLTRFPELSFLAEGQRVPCCSGPQFGSRYAMDPYQGQTHDMFPASMLSRLRNLDAFAGVLAFDKWLGNTDSRQAVFCKRSVEHKYRAVFIDHGYCFDGGAWQFTDHPLKGAFMENFPYGDIRDWQAFEPWLSRIEQISADTVWEAMSGVPKRWYENDLNGLSELADKIFNRRSKVRDLISSFRASRRNPFPYWGENKTLWLIIPELEPKAILGGKRTHKRGRPVLKSA